MEGFLFFLLSQPRKKEKLLNRLPTDITSCKKNWLRNIPSPPMRQSLLKSKYSKTFNTHPSILQVYNV